jgi:cyclopropane fatty-acyl-phospholipid synthase-like methyltransferase
VTDRRHFFEDFADFMGPAYLRYSFTKGTENEVSFLWKALNLAPGMTVLDVGCGPGRHALALARRGAKVVGVDIAATFIDLATQAAASEQLDVRFEVADARQLNFDGQFDAVVSLCQGGFGLVGRTQDGCADGSVLHRMAAALKPGGRLGLSAFSAYFQVRHLEPTDVFDAATGVNHEVTEIRNQAGDVKKVDLHTTCFTPRELQLLVERSGLQVQQLWSVTPGEYAEGALSIDRPEFLLIAERLSSSATEQCS